MSLKSIVLSAFVCLSISSSAFSIPTKTVSTDFSPSDLKNETTTEKHGDDINPIPLPDANKHSAVKEDGAAPSIEYDIEKLPSPVKLMRQKIIDAARSGDVNNLRVLFGNSNDPTQLSVADEVKDPIAFIKQLSGDGEGLETMAIMIDLLNSGYVHLSEGNDEEIYVWPYFVAVPLDKLNKAQLVQLFQIMTAGDLEEMKELGTYTFYRIGITPDGKWRFFVTGD